MRKRAFPFIAGLLCSYAGLGALLHLELLPEAAPDASVYPRAGDVIVNERAGERIVFTQTARETGGAHVRFELFLRPKGAIPLPHVHVHQEETFEVLRGELTLSIDGGRQRLTAGQSATVPRGARHQPWNDSGEAAVARVTFTPGGNADLMLAQTHGFFTAGPDFPAPFELFVQGMLYAPRYGTYLASSPVPLQRAAHFLIAPTARLFGYRSWYPEYTEKWRIDRIAARDERRR